jgi:hypothetical protein
MISQGQNLRLRELLLFLFDYILVDILQQTPPAHLWSQY